MGYRLFEDRSLITEEFYYNKSKYLMTTMLGCFDSFDRLVGFISYNKVDNSVIIQFVEVLEKDRHSHIARTLVRMLKEIGVVNLNSNVEVFAETYEGYCLFRNCVERGYLPDGTIIGGWNNASLCSEGSC